MCKMESGLRQPTESGGARCYTTAPQIEPTITLISIFPLGNLTEGGVKIQSHGPPRRRHRPASIGRTGLAWKFASSGVFF